MFDWGKFRNFALVKPKDVHQPLGWQALLTACEVQSTLQQNPGDRWWVLGDGGHYTSDSPSLQDRFKSVPLRPPSNSPEGERLKDSTAGYWAIKGKVNGIQTKGFKPMIY